MNEEKYEIISSAQTPPISYVLTCVHGTDCPHLTVTSLFYHFQQFLFSRLVPIAAVSYRRVFQ